VTPVEFGGDTDGGDVGARERQPISGGTRIYPDSGGSRPIDPIRESAQTKAN